MGTPGRIEALDVLRGVATLGVVAIHAGSTSEWSLHPMTIGRSVPVFLVLMGLSAELWRQRVQPQRWWSDYVTSVARRLFVPYAAWLVAVLGVATHADCLPEQLGMWLLAPVGYVPWAGPTWFIGAVFLLTPLIPILLLCADRYGAAVVAVLGLCATLGSQLHSLTLARAMAEVLPTTSDPMVMSLFWYFVPAYFWHLGAGIWLGKRGGQVSPALVAPCLLALLWCHLWLSEPGHFVLHDNAVFAFADVPLCLVLLSGSSALARVPGVGPLLGAIGRRSWGIYLAHVLVFDLFDLHGAHFQFGPARLRWSYFALLCGAGVALTAAGRVIRNRLGVRFPFLLPQAGPTQTKQAM